MFTDLSRRSALMMGAAMFTPLPAFAAQTAAASGPDAAFEALGQAALTEGFRLDPASATGTGEHRFDSDMPDLSPAGWAARAALNHALLARLDAIPRAGLSRANQVDAALLETSLKGDLWANEVNQSWAWDPLIHNGAAGGAFYSLIAREFAPLPDRLRSATARMEKLPGMLAGTRAAIDPARVPDIHAQTYSKQNGGVDGLIDQIAGMATDLPAADLTRLTAAATAAKAAVAEHQAWIDGTLVPNAKGDFRIGAARYDAKLAFALNSPMTRADIKVRAQGHLDRLTDEMYGLARTALDGKAGAPPTPAEASGEQKRAAIAAALELAYADRPGRADVLPLANAALAQATAFVGAKGLITLPTDPVAVIVLPEFQRGVAFAYCDSPGPLDRGQKTFYAVSPIPEDWTDVQTDSYLREYNTRSVHELTIHEAMPGHYVQLAHANAYPSVLRAVLGSGSFVEGWACYAQDVMADAGYYDGDPLYKLVHLKWQLRAISNAILDQAIHVDGMSRDDAMAFMVDHTFQQEREAAGKWTRAQLSSCQLPTYFVGWDEHHQLRAEIERREGAAFDLKAYHDKVLSFGSPPVRYARALMLDEAIA